MTSFNEPNFSQLRNLTIGMVEYVSPKEIKILLDMNAPKNTALNTGTPTLFPKINGFVLIPNEAGALVGLISWIGVEYSSYPKGKEQKDFDLIDLPFSLRKMSVSPLGILKLNPDSYEIERGVYSYPSVGDLVVLPSQEQLRAIIENKDANAKIKIGHSPLAANAPVYVNPDRLFGRHIAVLGNTGSGKSCSVAGLIRWSIEEAKQMKTDSMNNPNARFIILDPNGEYTKAFDDVATKVKKFKVFPELASDFEQLRVPAWMWNSYEWSSITQASGRTQRPILRRALRELRNGSTNGVDDETLKIRRYYSSCLVELKNDLAKGASAFKGKPGKNEFGKKLQSIADDVLEDSNIIIDVNIKTSLTQLSTSLNNITAPKYNTYQGVDYYTDFQKSDVESAITKIEDFLSSIGGMSDIEGPNEDSPVQFNGEDLPNHIERLSQEQNIQQFLDFLVMRVRTMLADTRMNSIISTENDIDLVSWLEQYIGNNEASGGEITVIDLSIVPADILHTVIAVISRIIFEALQRYRRKTNTVLPTVLVMEEAHNFISRYHDTEELSPAKLCTESFEKIAKEGRKFGLGLMLSSQRPSELSATVLSQCNTFLLHRIVNDKDQELVKKFVPDSLGNLLNELPILPTRKAILLGWAAPIPTLVEMNNLKKEHRPQSHDPDFWDVWTGKEKRVVDWNDLVEEWQN